MPIFTTQIIHRDRAFCCKSYQTKLQCLTHLILLSQTYIPQQAISTTNIRIYLHKFSDMPNMQKSVIAHRITVGLQPS